MMIIDEELSIVKKLMSESFEESVLDDELKSFVMSGSKFIRSVLSILFFKSQNCDLSENFYKILCCGEFVHNSSLLHDDVLDDAETRRGTTTIAKKYSEKISILAGDYLLSKAIKKLLEIGNLEVLDMFRNCTKTMSLAEINQFFKRGILPAKDEYINICRDKTAELFSTILESCSLTLSCDRLIARKFGELFGVCFQIRNDMNKESSIIDKKNLIYTANDILGIEKTNILLDNYKEELISIISSFEDNLYKEHLKDIIKNL